MMGGLARYVASRLASGVLVVWLVTTVCFVALHLAGDPVLMLMPAGSPQNVLDDARHALGYDRPFLEQYLVFLGQAVTGRFPDSLVTGQPALQLVLDRLPATIDLALGAGIVALALGLVLGTLSERARFRPVRVLSATIVSILQATPSFFLAILGILLFAVQLRLVPTGGSGTPVQLVLPALTLGLSVVPNIARVYRGTLSEVVEQDYVFALRARGIGGARLGLRHVLPNSALPVITVLGMEIGHLVGGSVIVETIFSWPGVGRLLVDSIFQKDFPVVLAGIVFLSAAMAVINVIVDLLYLLIDPRVRLGGERGSR